VNKSIEFQTNPILVKHAVGVAFRRLLNGWKDDHDALDGRDQSASNNLMRATANGWTHTGEIRFLKDSYCG
jgi:hypothetical protein